MRTATPSGVTTIGRPAEREVHAEGVGRVVGLALELAQRGIDDLLVQRAQAGEIGAPDPEAQGASERALVVAEEARIDGVGDVAEQVVERVDAGAPVGRHQTRLLVHALVDLRAAALAKSDAALGDQLGERGRDLVRGVLRDRLGDAGFAQRLAPEEELDPARQPHLDIGGEEVPLEAARQERDGPHADRQRLADLVHLEAGGAQLVVVRHLDPVLERAELDAERAPEADRGQEHRVGDALLELAGILSRVTGHLRP